jgi:hypothetical protein
MGGPQLQAARRDEATGLDEALRRSRDAVHHGERVTDPNWRAAGNSAIAR